MINFLITTVPLIWTFYQLQYLELTKQKVEFKTFGKFFIYQLKGIDESSLHFESLSSFRQDHNYSIICAGKVPINISQNFEFFPLNNNQSFSTDSIATKICNNSCIYLSKDDFSSKFLTSDSFGIIPLWYQANIHQDQFCLTSEYLLAKIFGYENLYDIGPNQFIEMDFNGEILSHRQHINYQNNLIITNENDIEYSNTLYNLGLLSTLPNVMMQLDYEASEIPFEIVTEFDHLSESSIFLSCLLDKYQLKRQTYYSPMDTIQLSNQSYPESFVPFLNFISDHISDKNRKLSQSMHLLAYRNWKLCKKEKNTHKLVISSKDIFQYHPLSSYFLNLFCSIFDTIVEFPFNELQFNQYLNSFQNPESLFNRAINYYLNRPQFCPNPQLNSKNMSLSLLKDDLYSDQIGHNNDYYLNMSHISYIIGDFKVRKHMLISQWGDLYYQEYLLQLAKKYAYKESLLMIFTLAQYDEKEIYLLKNLFCELQTTYFTTNVHLPIILLVTDLLSEEAVKEFNIGIINIRNWQFSLDTIDLQPQKFLPIVKNEVILHLLTLNFSLTVHSSRSLWKTHILDEMKAFDNFPFELIFALDGMDISFLHLIPGDNLKLFWSQYNLDCHSSGEELSLLTQLSTTNITMQLRKLSSGFFPSTIEFFHERNENGDFKYSELMLTPPSYHLNIDSLIYRLARFQLIFYFQNNATFNITEFWVQYFDLPIQKMYSNSLNIFSPVHNTYISNSSNKLFLHIGFEGLPVVSLQKLPCFVHLDGRILSRLQYEYKQNFNTEEYFMNETFGFTVLVENTKLQATVDVSLNHPGFFTDHFPQEIAFNNLQNLLLKPISEPIINELDPLIFSIKVIAFKRIDGLIRLLSSLEKANYLEHSGAINLSIFIDKGRDEKEQILVDSVIKVASEFDWNHGEKTIIIRDKNIGLPNQWRTVWSPEKDNEIAFIFEDDQEVSPYFFEWATLASEKYYFNSSQQLQLHRELASIIYKAIERNSSSFDFKDFLHSYAGLPLFYGLCLQRQPLDPLHFPKTAEIRNGYRPFLYSQIGTWGPAFFPVIWKAFLSWWDYQTTNLKLVPITSKLISNSFYFHNNRIWSPYIIRFAFDTGAKCFYPNLPSNFTLVNNYREAGENYMYNAGKYARLVSSLILKDIFHHQPNISSFEDTFSVNFREFKSSLTYFPSLHELSLFQYDFSLRRLGDVSSDGKQPLRSFGSTRQIEIFNNLRSKYDNLETKLYGSNTAVFVNISSIHLLEIEKLLLNILLPESVIISLELSPLIISTVTPSFPIYTITKHSNIFSNWDLIQLYLFPSGRDNYPFNHFNPLDCIHQSDRDFWDVSEFNQPNSVLVLSSSFLTHHLKLILRSNSPVEFILLITPYCLSAPNQIIITYQSQVKTESKHEYIAFEDICSTNPSHFSGAIIFRLQDSFFRMHGDDSMQSFYHISRRIDEDLVHRQFVPVYQHIVPSS